MRVIAPALLAFLLACGGDDVPTQDGAPELSSADMLGDLDLPDLGADARLFDAQQPDSAQPDMSLADAAELLDRGVQSEIEQVRARFGLLQTIAGTGHIGDKGVNGWSARFEGGSATEAELSRPHMAMADAEGNVYIADKDAHAIRRVTPDGTISTVAGTNIAGDDGDSGQANQMRLSAPNGLWVQPDGTLFILDLGNSAIRRVSPDGQLTTLIRDPLGMTTGRGLWVSADATLVYYAAGSEVRQWRRGSGVQRVVGGFTSLGNLVVDPNGHLVVTDRGGHRVYRIIDGVATAIAGNGTPDGGGDRQPALESGLEQVRGIWFHPLGGYFLATHRGSQLWYVDTQGIIHLFIDGDRDRGTHAGDGAPFDSPGRKLSELRAITMAPDGSLIITENDGGYIRRVEVR